VRHNASACEMSGKVIRSRSGTLGQPWISRKRDLRRTKTINGKTATTYRSGRGQSKVMARPPSLFSMYTRQAARLSLSSARNGSSLLEHAGDAIGFGLVSLLAKGVCDLMANSEVEQVLNGHMPPSA
jgi:hypothetical protein